MPPTFHVVKGNHATYGFTHDVEEVILEALDAFILLDWKLINIKLRKTMDFVFCRPYIQWSLMMSSIFYVSIDC
jgi:hypothetical protein